MRMLIKSFSTPIMWVLLLMAFGLILERFRSHRRLRRYGWFSVMVAVLLLYLLSIPAVSNRLLYSLECQYCEPETEVLSRLDVVVILGSGYYPSGELRKSPEPSERAYARVFGGVKAFQQSRAGTLALCEGRRDQTGESGAEVMKALAMELGVQEHKIITEKKSHNTMQNAMELKKLLLTDGPRNIGLVTSALHMTRSERVFKEVFSEDTIVPIPVHFRYTRPKGFLESVIPSARALQTSTEAVHEWIGMFWYAIRY